MQRQYLIEGAVHVYSSPPAILFPSELYLAKKHPEIRARLEMANLYMIVSRKKIYIDGETLKVIGERIVGVLVVQRSDGWQRLDFSFPMGHEHHLGAPGAVIVDCESSSSYITITNIASQAIRIPTYILVASGCAAFGKETDLDVLYVGVGVGNKRPRIAIDRLLTHYQLQKILATTTTEEPNRDVLILTFNFEHSRKILSNGGDFGLDVAATEQEEDKHFSELKEASLDRKNRIMLAEATLINHFQPPYNTMHRRTDFTKSRRMVLTRALDKQGIAGVITEICTSNINSKLKSIACPPMSLEELLPGADFSWIESASAEERASALSWLNDVQHTCYIQTPLTSPMIRNTFLHGLFGQ